MQVEILKKSWLLVLVFYPQKTLSLQNLIKKHLIIKFSINWCIVNVNNTSIEFYREYEK